MRRGAFKPSRALTRQSWPPVSTYRTVTLIRSPARRLLLAMSPSRTSCVKATFRRQTVPDCACVRMCVHVSLRARAVDRRWQVVLQEKGAGADTSLFVSRAGIAPSRWSGLSAVFCHIVNICLQWAARPLNLYKCLSAVGLDRKPYCSFILCKLSLSFRICVCVCVWVSESVYTLCRRTLWVW